MDSRQQFEEWARKMSMDLEYRNIPGVGQFYECPRTLLALEAWQAAREESEELKKARLNLADAVHAMTDSLDYEWEGDWRPEIEKLNGAHMRYSVIYKRARK